MRLIQLISKESRPVNIHDCKYATRQGIEILFVTNTFVSAVQTINALTMSREGKGKVTMGDFGYIYGYFLGFCFFVGGLLGFVVGKWFDK